MPNPLSGLMLGLLGAGNALESGVSAYERKKQSEAKSKLESTQTEEMQAHTDLYEAEAGLKDRTDPNRPRVNPKDITTNALRASVDTYLNRSKTVPLSPEEQSDFDAKNAELNRRLGVRPGAPKKQSAPEDAGGFHPVVNLLKFLTGGTGASSQPAAAQNPKWQQYDQ